MAFFCAQRKVKSWWSILTELRWMEPLHICQHAQISTVHARDCTEEGCGPTVSIFIPVRLMDAGVVLGCQQHR